MKKLICMMLAFAMCLSLVACGGSEAPETTEAPAATETIPVETEAPTEPPLTPEEVFATVGTLENRQIMDTKALTYVYEIQDGTVLSKELVPDRLTGESVPESPEEVRYLVNIKYTARRVSNYIGLVKVFSCSIDAEVVDVITGEVIAEEHFAGEPLPEQVVSNTMTYYGEYPEESPVQEWVLGVLEADRAQNLEYVMETVETQYVGKGFSYKDLQESLYSSGKFTAVEVAYAASQYKTDLNAEAAAELSDMDWNEEAVIRAKSWLENGVGYSPQQLLDNLVSISGFTEEQAAYAVENCGADWNEEALKTAKYFLEIGMGYSYSSMILVMTADYGFTQEQAEYAANNCGADWNEVAVDHVVLFMEYSDEVYTRDQMIEEMVKYYGFTEEQATYAVDKVGLTNP